MSADTEEANARLGGLQLSLVELCAKIARKRVLVTHGAALRFPGLVERLAAIRTDRPREASRKLLSVALDLSVILRSIEYSLSIETRIGNAMSQSAATLYRQEARRQALIGIEIVDGAIVTEQLIPETASDGGVDRVSLKRLRDVLEEEVAKLEANEATIAVIGAMKSGKSTTINAIVGSEVVPSRDKPMTSFPTIVTHRPGLVEPVFTFPLSPAFTELSLNIADHLRQSGANALESLRGKKGAEDLTTLATAILDGDLQLPATTLGYEAIRSLLVQVNDLTRLARTLGVGIEGIDSALAYRTVPRIEVEFEHLIGIDGTLSGTLSLIDTPGPDEAIDSKRLESISREQLEKASAIILVVNYRLEGGEAAEKVERLLNLLPIGATDRLFVFANQYDLREERGDDIDDTVRDTLEQDRIEKNKEEISAQIFGALGAYDSQSRHRVFPTSARQALRANQARRALRVDRALSGKNAWTREFAADVGAIYGKTLSPPPNLRDSDGATEALKALWEESLFPKPLADVIATSARNSSLILVQSCLDKLKGGEMSRLFERLDIAVGAFGAKTDQLKLLIDNLSADMQLIDRLEQTNRERIDEVTKKIRPRLGTYARESVKSIQAVVDTYMKTGSPAEAQEVARKKSESENEKRRSLLEFLEDAARWAVGATTSQKEAPDSARVAVPEPDLGNAPTFQASWSVQGRLRMSSAREAKEKSEEIYDSLEAILQTATTSLMDTVRVSLRQVATDARASVNASFSGGWREVQKHVSEVLAVEVSLPDIDDDFSDAISFGKESRESGTGSVQRSTTVMRDREGLGSSAKRVAGSLLGLFGLETSHWGRTPETTYSTEYFVELGQIRDELLVKSGVVAGSVEATVGDCLERLDQALDNYATEVRSKVEQIHRFICEEISNRQDDADRYANLRRVVSRLAAQALDLKSEAAVLRAELQ